MFAGFCITMDLSIIIPDSLAGLRLDQVISQQVPECSRSRATALIAKGDIQVCNFTKRPGYRVKLGEIITGRITESADASLPVPESLDLSIIHEDDQLLVVDKPAGMVVHPAPGHLSGTLVNALLSHDPCFRERHWDPVRPGIVHRLDMDTSGLIVVAKTLKSHAFLQKEFKHRRVNKHYLALVQGDVIPESGVIELPIGRHPKKRKIMAVNEAGKHAKTGFRVQERFRDGALIDVRLYTGRTHQIRVHFYAQGYPLYGDRVYQLRRYRKGVSIAPRQMLHSWQLSFRHPYSGLRLQFEAPMPEDFKQIIEKLSSLSS